MLVLILINATIYIYLQFCFVLAYFFPSLQTGDGDLDDDDDEEKYADNADMPGTKVDSKQRITVRNLRIREDTAKVFQTRNF